MRIINLPKLGGMPANVTGILPLAALIDFTDPEQILHFYQLSGRGMMWNWVITPACARLILSHDGTGACCLDQGSAVPPLLCLDGRWGDLYHCSNPSTIRACMEVEALRKIKIVPLAREQSRVQPQSVQSQPLQPQCVQSRPLQLQRVQSQPLRLQSVQSQPLRLQRVHSEPLQPQSVHSEPLQLQRVQSQLLRPQRVQSEPLQLQHVESQSLLLQRIQSQLLRPQRIQSLLLLLQRVQSQLLLLPRVRPQPLRPQRLRVILVSPAESTGLFWDFLWYGAIVSVSGLVFLALLVTTALAELYVATSYLFVILLTGVVIHVSYGRHARLITKQEPPFFVRLVIVADNFNEDEWTAFICKWALLF